MKSAEALLWYLEECIVRWLFEIIAPVVQRHGCEDCRRPIGIVTSY